MSLRLLLILVCAANLAACATVNRGVEDYMRVDTVPQGAKVTVERKRNYTKDRHTRRQKKPYIETFICEATPCAIAVPRRSKLLVTIEKLGFETSEIYIGSSTKRGGAIGSMAANSVTLAGIGAGYGAFVAGFGNAVSLGLTNYSSSAFAASGAAIGLGAGAGMIAIDAATGSNLNLYPNPIVLGLVPEGSKTIKDPRVIPYRAKIEAEADIRAYCNQTHPKKRPLYEEKCVAAESRQKEATMTYNAVMAEIDTKEKAALAKAKAASKKRN